MRLRQLFAAGVDIVLPPQSLLTGDLADINAGTDLWTQLNFLDEPCCYHCGFPFEFDEGEKALCVRCSIKRPPYEMARAPFCYDDKSRAMVLSFKHGGRTEGLGVFAAQMKRAGRRFLGEADLLVPVPLHFGRRVQRRYNQAALLARALAKISAPEFAPDILMRHKSTPSQGGLSAPARRRNVQSAFRVRAKAKPGLAGAHVVLVDDVMTTGATLGACSRTLLRAGTARVDVITLSRVVKAARALK